MASEAPTWFKQSGTGDKKIRDGLSSGNDEPVTLKCFDESGAQLSAALQSALKRYRNN